MIRPDDASASPLPGPSAEGDQSVPSGLPDELTCLPRWAYWRTWKKAGRVTREPVHPATGKNLKVSEPDTWVRFDEVVGRPAGRKPAAGIGLVVTAEDGFAVVLKAPVELLTRLGPRVVYAERAVDGVGLTIIVRLGIHGAKTNRFVPLSGQSPYQGHPNEGRRVNPDAIRTQSGQTPYQEDDQSGPEPYQESGTNPDECRTFFSSYLQNNYHGVEEDQIRTELEEYGRVVYEQGNAGERGRWVYGLIGLLRRHGLTPQTTPHTLLLIFAERVGEDVGAVLRLVQARWANWRPHKVPLADALSAVKADHSLLTDLLPVLADEVTLLAAGMCKFMGAGGAPFALPGWVLAQVLGLNSQQEGSDVVRALVGLGLIKMVKEGSYADKRAAEYVWLKAVVQPVPPQTENPLLTAQRPSSCRPGHSHEQTTKFRFRSKLGGYLTDEHYLAEMMLSRRLGREGKDLFAGSWAHLELGPEYGRQVVAARSLLETFHINAVCRALRSKDGQSVYSLAASHVVDLVKAEQVRLDRPAAPRTTVVAAQPTEPVQAPGPRPAFVQRTTLQKLKGL